MDHVRASVVLTSLAALLGLGAAAGCAATPDDGAVTLSPADGKEDGSSTTTNDLSRSKRTGTVRIECDEWFSCDLDVRTAFSSPDLTGLYGEHGVIRGVGATVLRDGTPIWSGTVTAYIAPDKHAYFNGLVATGELDDGTIDLSDGELSLDGDKDSIFEIQYDLDDLGVQQLDANNRALVTITTTAKWH